ncbi:MAG TPA: hypothetical protein VN778_02260 [Verrucomicrobiae bacterium]|nr:hypothetical protein [Verrucomicrobiae bacterium]
MADLVLQATELRKSFTTRRGQKAVTAVDGVDLEIKKGRSLRLFRPQRCWQDHNLAHADDLATD